jgi:hypothetical protein
MTQQEALDLIRRFLKAGDRDELMQLVSQHLGAVDGTFFKVAEAAARQLEEEGKASVAAALRSLSDSILRMKTLI